MIKSKPLEKIPEGPVDDAIALEVITRNNNTCLVIEARCNALQEWAKPK